MSAPARVLVFPVESPIERAAHSTTVALEDLDAALWQASTDAEIAFAHELIKGVLRRVTITECIAETRRQFPR